MAASPSSVPAGLTGDNAVDSITTGYSWQLDSSRTVNWSISGGLNGEYWTNPTATVTQIDTALRLFSYYADIRFNYVGRFDTPISAGAYSQINYSLSTVGQVFSSSNIWAIGLFPNAAYSQTAYNGAPGDVYFNVSSQANYLPSYAVGTAGFALVLHETGHALGLKHTHDDGGTGRPTLSSLGNATLDKDWMSIMSYNDAYAWNLMAWEPSTPMALDAIGLMAMYGKNMTTNSGDNVVTVSDTNGYLTRWDAGGNDTLSAISSTKGWYVALGLEHNKYVDIDVGLACPYAQLNLAQPTSLMWLLGTHENIIGSSFVDKFVGNDLNNNFRGNGGNDAIEGGGGIDTCLYSGTRDAYRITQVGSGKYAISGGTDGTDTLTDIEALRFANGEVLPLAKEGVEIRMVEPEATKKNYFLLNLPVQSADIVAYFSTLTAGTATAGEDYVATTQTVVIAAGTESYAFGVDILSNGYAEPEEGIYAKVILQISGQANIELVAVHYLEAHAAL